MRVLLLCVCDNSISSWTNLLSNASTREIDYLKIMIIFSTDEYIDGESFLELTDNLMYLQWIPKYGLQTKFRKLYKRITGKNLCIALVTHAFNHAHTQMIVIMTRSMHIYRN